MLFSLSGEISGDFCFPFYTSPDLLQRIWMTFLIRKLRNIGFFSVYAVRNNRLDRLLSVSHGSLIILILQMNRLSLRKVKSLAQGCTVKTQWSAAGFGCPDPSAQLFSTLPLISTALSRDARASRGGGSLPRKKWGGDEELPLFHSNCPRVICLGKMRLWGNKKPYERPGQSSRLFWQWSEQ